MADETSTTAPVDAQAPATATDSAEPTTHTNGDSAAPVEKKEESEAAAEHTKLEESAASDEKAQQSESASAEPASVAAPASGSKDKKRKSTGGVPEHKKNKGLNKKKSMPTLRLECKAGEFYWARLKGYPPWPAIICDEEMLPESLLATRPVSTARPDGSLRDDFKEGGKNAKERTFPIMFLHTNEFQWMVNTALTPLEPEDCLKLPKTKMTKALTEAYKVASEGHDIEYYKDLLRQHQQELEKYQQDLAEQEERIAAEAAAKADGFEIEGESVPKEKKKKAPRKSKAADEDVEMEDADAPKSTKKRKKAEESDADTPKPKKTPKVTKLNAPKTPNGEASATKKSKPKKKVVSAPKVDEEKPQMTEEERLAQREKAVLYLRHRLQKAFLARDSTPKEEEMAGMADFFGQLEAYDNLETSIIRTTKIHKVLKAIVKLGAIPRDDEFNFKRRSTAMLEVWNKRMESEPGVQPGAEDKEKPAAAVEPETPRANGASETPAESNGDSAAKEIAEAGTTKAEAEEGAAKPAEGQEIEMQDAEASEKPAETQAENKADSAANGIEEKSETVFASAETKSAEATETPAASA